MVPADLGGTTRDLGDGVVKISGAEAAQCHLDLSHLIESAGGGDIEFFGSCNHLPNVCRAAAAVKPPATSHE